MKSEEIEGQGNRQEENRREERAGKGIETWLVIVMRARGLGKDEREEKNLGLWRVFNHREANLTGTAAALELGLLT